MVKKMVIRVGILTLVFIFAVILFSYLTNRSNTDMSADMGSAQLPRISFLTEGYEINSLPGYRQEMEISTMRDTVVPVDQYQAELKITDFGTEIQSLTWQVYSLNGQEVFQEETVKDPEETVTLKFDAQKALTQERVLRVTLKIEDYEVYYYTRIKDAADTDYVTCLGFAQNFLNAEMDKNQQDKLSEYLENGSDTGFGLHRVTLYSDVDSVTWGSMKPELKGDVRWEIKECNETYTSLMLYYQVTTPETEDAENARYSVEEFFRIRISGDKQYLLDYCRTTNQVFGGEKGALNEKGVLLGIAPSDFPHKNNSEGTIVSFVQNRELWSYDRDEDELSLVFSFADSESQDVRNIYDRHEIEILSVEKDGSTTFTVCGYMNRGTHEGRTGVAVYYFDAEKNYVEEKAFIPGIKGYEVMREELGKLVYYSSENQRLYAMVDGTLYCVDLLEDTREVLVRGLEDDQYQMADDGSLIAYQVDGNLNDSQKMTLLNLESGESISITAGENTCIRPLGFIRKDLVYGTLRSEDAGQTSAGQSVFPMYRLDIVNQEGEVQKTYEAEGVYILDGYIEDNMLTISRASRNGNVYTGIANDYITNNEKEEESNIMAETYTDTARGTVIRLTFEDGISDSHPKILKPKQVLYDKAIVIEFDASETEGTYYVYARGTLQGVYDKAGYAVQRAADVSGVAVTARQAYLWEKGNLPTIYEVDDMEPFAAADGESTLAACLRQMLVKEGKQADVVQELENGTSPEDILTARIGGEGLDLTGCTVEQILYTISRETPAIAMLEGGHAVLLIGYNQTNVAYLDPADGQRYSVTKAALQSMVNAGGNTFIGYAK